MAIPAFAHTSRDRVSILLFSWNNFFMLYLSTHVKQFDDHLSTRLQLVDDNLSRTCVNTLIVNYLHKLNISNRRLVNGTSNGRSGARTRNWMECQGYGSLDRFATSPLQDQDTDGTGEGCSNSLSEKDESWEGNLSVLTLNLLLAKSSTIVDEVARF